LKLLAGKNVPNGKVIVFIEILANIFLLTRDEDKTDINEF
jgi:hypothetical protein